MKLNICYLFFLWAQIRMDNAGNLVRLIPRCGDVS